MINGGMKSNLLFNIISYVNLRSGNLKSYYARMIFSADAWHPAVMKSSYNKLEDVNNNCNSVVL